MKISVIICTYNRCGMLPEALESVAVSVMPDSIPWEVLVVDNNSSDRTREVVDKFCNRYPGRFRYLFEARQGKSNALNTGITSAAGDILAFTDDDIVVAPDWLRNLTTPLYSGQWSSTGGRIELANSFQCPPWLALEGEFGLGGVLGFFDRGEKACESAEPFWGGNVAYRRELFEKHGLYRTDLGRSGTNLMANEDTELSGRMMKNGERLWYEPSAVVYHAVPENRLSQNYFLDFAYTQGRSRIRETANRSSIYRIPRWCFSAPSTIVKLLIPRTLKWLFARDPKQRFFFKWAVWGCLGMITELPRVWLEEKRRVRRHDLMPASGEATAHD